MATGDAGGAAWQGVGSAQAEMLSRRTVGPGAYTPRHTQSEATAPSVPFGTAARFLPSGVGFISPHHNAGLLCTASPGPKYNTQPGPATYPRQPALGWGPRDQALLREKKASFLQQAGDNDVGPAAYSPRHANIKPAAPRCSFSRSTRFGGAGSYQVLNNSSSSSASSAPSGALSALQPNLDAVSAASPRFSFGPPRPSDPHSLAGAQSQGQAQAHEPLRYKPRTSFMTHNIRGGLAKPATLESGIGPGDYNPIEGQLGQRLAALRAGSGAAAAGKGFGSESRFVKPGVQYNGPEHARQIVGQAGPGPKYLITINDTASRSKSPRSGGLKWLP